MVMIEYRNRGVPWWVVVPILVLPPVLAVLAYRYSVVEGYLTKEAKTAYLLKKLSIENANAPLPDPSTAPEARHSAAPAPESVATVAGPPAAAVPATNSQAAAPPDSTKGGKQAGPDATPDLASSATPEPLKGRVRSIMPSPFELDDSDLGQVDTGHAGVSAKPSNGKPAVADAGSRQARRFERPTDCACDSRSRRRGCSKAGWEVQLETRFAGRSGASERLAEACYGKAAVTHQRRV